MRHTGCVSSFLRNRYLNLFLYKETHFFGFIQFSSLLAQLCNLVAHTVGETSPGHLEPLRGAKLYRDSQVSRMN
jgi:hypothetical protein